MVSPLKSANWIFSEFYEVCMCRKFVSNKFHPKGNTFISYAHFQSLTPQLGALYKLTSGEPFKLRHQ